MFFSFFFSFFKLFFSQIILTNSTIFLFFSIQKMDFILNEAIEEDNDFKLVFSDESDGELFEEEVGEELNFINDTIEEEETQDESFYRKVDNQPLKFLNQTRNFTEVLQNEDHEYYGDDDLPELFNPENREEVEFDTSEKK